jgi:hypothetical protein
MALKTISNYSKFIPYLYFIAVTVYWFADINRSNSINAYPILLFGIPFLWQILKPNRKLNLVLGITFVCLSSYLVLAYLLDVFDVESLTKRTTRFIIYGGVFVASNFIMAIWIIRNSLKRAF